MRERCVADCKRVSWIIGNLPHLTGEQIRRNMALALSGIIGYYGRSTVITWEDCQRESIEQVRASALNAKGYSVGIPRLQIYDLKERGGMGMEHAYTYALCSGGADRSSGPGPQRGGRGTSEGGRREQPSAHFEEAGMPK